MLRHPVVLMHGFGVLLNSYLPHHFHLVHKLFTGRGIQTFLPQISPYNPPDVRFHEWKAWILAHGPEKFHLVAHSQGGLEAVLLAHDTDVADRIVSIHTVATPFAGTVVPSLFRIAPPPIARKVYKEMTRAAKRFFPHVEPDAVRAMHALKFPPELNPPEKIPVFSYACKVPVSRFLQLPFPFWIPFLLLQMRQGENDGLVSFKSQQFGSVVAPFRLNHGEQLGIFVRNKDRREYNRLWETVFNNLETIERNHPLLSASTSADNVNDVKSVAPGSN